MTTLSHRDASYLEIPCAKPQAGLPRLSCQVCHMECQHAHLLAGSKKQFSVSTWRLAMRRWEHANQGVAEPERKQLSCNNAEHEVTEKT